MSNMIRNPNINTQKENITHSKKYSKHQNDIKRKFEKQYGKMTLNNIKCTLARLKQDLAVECEKFRRRKLIQERKYINRIFKVAPKKIYREMRSGSKTKVTQMPEQSKVEDFWSTLGSQPLQHSTEAPWLKDLKEEYCKDVKPKTYKITYEGLEKSSE